jgi:hypothetical protein
VTVNWEKREYFRKYLAQIINVTASMNSKHGAHSMARGAVAKERPPCSIHARSMRDLAHALLARADEVIE